MPSVAHELGNRVAVVGTTGSGKTTLAGALATSLDRPHVELDALHWEPDWQEASVEVFRERVAEALNGSHWIVDGNYGQVRDIVWARADTIVWLDYPLRVILARLVRRTIRRVITREELWNGNRERWRDQLSRDSIVLYALRTYRARRREYAELIGHPEHGHLRTVRLRSPRAADAWLRGLTEQPLPA